MDLIIFLICIFLSLFFIVIGLLYDRVISLLLGGLLFMILGLVVLGWGIEIPSGATITKINNSIIIHYDNVVFHGVLLSKGLSLLLFIIGFYFSGLSVYNFVVGRRNNSEREYYEEEV